MAINLQAVRSVVSRGVENAINKAANSKVMRKAFSERAGEIAATVALASTTTKDAVNCFYYTTQSLKNEKIPEEKRKFVAMIDLANGALNVVSQLTLGMWIKNKAPKLFEYFFRNSKLQGPTRKVAKNGFVLLTTLVTAQILLKRVLTPFLSTPMAHYLKDYAEKKQGPKAENTQSKQSQQSQSVDIVSASDNKVFTHFNNFMK